MKTKIFFASLIIAAAALITENKIFAQPPSGGPGTSIIIDGEAMPLNLFVEISNHVNPTVVNISTTQVLHGRGGMYGGNPGGPGGGGGQMPGMPYDPFRQFFEEWMGPNGPGGGRSYQAPEEKATSLGSGFIIDPSGLILTNNHVIQNASEISVQLTEKSKQTYKAKVIGSDKRTDVALIKITPDTKLFAVPLGDSDKIQVGEWVAAFGNPFGHGHTMTKGIISAKDREIDDLGPGYFPFLQTDASINPGNSGGPLVNTHGEVVGINSAIDARAQGVGFAIPINVVKKLLPDLKTKGKITRGFIGVGINNIDERMTRQFGLKSDKGALIVNLTPGGPALRAGARPYDIITEFNGKEVDSVRTLMIAVADTKIGDTVKMKVIREGQTVSLNVKVTDQSAELAALGEGEGNDENAPPPQGKKAPFSLGLDLADLTPGLARQLELPDAPKKGVVITNVLEGSLAAQAGLEVADIILDINRSPVKSAAQALKLFKRGSNSLRVLRGQNTVLIFMDGR